jgi:hypothetical protein
MTVKRREKASFVHTVLRLSGHRLTAFCAGFVVLTLVNVLAPATVLAATVSYTVDGWGPTQYPGPVTPPAGAPWGQNGYPGDTLELLTYTGTLDLTPGSYTQALNTLAWTIDYTYGGTATDWSESAWSDLFFNVNAVRNISFGAVQGSLTQTGTLESTWNYDSLTLNAGHGIALLVQGQRVDITPLGCGPTESGNLGVQPSCDVMARFDVCGRAPTNLYVSTGGNDTGNDCTIAGNPCLTIQHAVDEACGGDTINVSPGTYSETASVPSPPACPADTVGLYIAKNGITIQGVDSSGNPITDAASVQATVNTNSDLCFGPDGFFVTGDNVTIAGIRVGTNTGGQNKTIEIWGDNFTLKNCDIADVQGSVYFNDSTCSDPTATSSHIQTYTIQGNIFEDGVSLDITNGAGLSGPVSGRVVSGDTFKNLATIAGAEYWPSVSFDGSGTSIPWFVCSVGGATITGNTFSNSAPDGQLIRARGTYDNTQFDWASYWNTNTFNKAAVVGSTPPSVVETYSYPSSNDYCTSGPPSPAPYSCCTGAGTGTCMFDNVRRIGAIIQGEVDNAQAGDTVLVAAGTYTENVTIGVALTLAGAGQGSTIIQPAVSNPNCGGGGGGSLCSGGSNVILVQADNVSIHDLTIEGDNPGLGSDIDARNGIITNHLVGTFNNLEVGHVTVQDVYLRGIYASSGGTFNFHDNTVANVQADPSSVAMFNFGGSGIMARNTVSDANDAISANWSTGTQFLNNTITNSGSGVHTDNTGAADLIQGNTVGDCTPDGWGIFVFVPYVAPTVQGNTITNCSVGLAAAGSAEPVTTLFQDNAVDGAHSPGSTGVYVTTSEFGYGASNVNATFTGNEVLNNTNGFLLQDKTCSVTSTQGCNADADCPSGETCLVGTSVTLNASCNLVAGNGTGILTENLSSPAGAAFSGNSIVDNGIGADGTAIASGEIDATGNWWGCAAGPGGYGCDTVTAGVDASSQAGAPPTCVSCVSNADCDDGLACNGAETCNTSTHVCHNAVAPVSCPTDSCHVGTCTEPHGTCDYTAKPDYTPCNTGDLCEAGVCTGENTVSVAIVRLKRNTAKSTKGSNGSAYVNAVVNDADTGGKLVTDLQTQSGVTLAVQDGGAFSVTITLKSCTVGRGGKVTCKDRSTKTSATFTRVRRYLGGVYGSGYGYLYKMVVLRWGLGTSDTGNNQPVGPVQLTLHQSLVVRLQGVSTSEGTGTCAQVGKNKLVCHG